jgi:copper chaperone CopZ
MRQLLIVAVLFCLSASVFGADETVLEIDIKGMTCPFCVYSLEKELGKLSEVEEVLISLKSNKARLTLKEGAQIDSDTLQEVVLQAGYTPGEVRDVSEGK